jgi:hypothetical protein
MALHDQTNFLILPIKQQLMIELKKISPDDTLEISKMKDEFNRYAMQMKIQWQELSFEERKDLYEKLRKVEDLLSAHE